MASPQSTRFAAAVCLTVALAAVQARPAGAQTAADLFDDRVLHTLQIAMHSRDWDALRAHFMENTFYPADMTWNGIRVASVGIRSRGGGSRHQLKPGLELDFRHYTTQGQFLGLHGLVLDNLVTDVTMLRERVSMAFLRRFGVPAPREAHAQVFINGQYAGVYAIVERIDADFAREAFPDNGTLFEFRWLWPYYGDYLGDDLDLYRPLFEPRTNETQSIFDLYDPLRELVHVINDAPAATFRETVGEYLDLDATLRLIAAEAFLVEVDGFLGYAGMNNFYLYRHGGTRRHRLLPWDKDHSLLQWNYPILTGAADNALMRRVLQDPELSARYFDYVLEAVDTALDEDWLVQEILTAAGQIREAALADPLQPYADEDVEQAVADLLHFAAARPGFVLDELRRYQTRR